MEEKVINAIKQVFDPEISVNIYDLGLIYDIKINGQEVGIVMTLTSPNCPVAESLPVNVKTAVEALPEVSICTVELVFEPPWDTSKMSEEAQLELGLL